MKSHLLTLASLLPLASSATVYTYVDTYAVNRGTKVYGLNDSDTGIFSSFSEVTSAQFNWHDTRDVSAFAQAGPNLLKSSVVVQGATTGTLDLPGFPTFVNDVQAGGTAFTGSDVNWASLNSSAAPGATLPVAFNFSYHGVFDVPTVGGDLGWNRTSAEFRFNIFTLGAEAPPVRSFVAQFGLNSSGTGLMFNPLGFDVFDETGGTVATILPSFISLPGGSNTFDFAVAGSIPFNAVNQSNFRVEFDVNVLAATSDTDLVHEAIFENTASYSITSTDPDTTLTLIPEPGSLSLAALASLIFASRRSRHSLIAPPSQNSPH